MFRSDIERWVREDPCQIPEVWVSSYGGSGSNLLVDWVQRFRRARTHLYDLSLCHWWEPLDLGVPRLLILGHPVLAYRSMERRKMLFLNAYKASGYRASPAFAMLTHLRNWRDEPCVKYEHLWEHLPEVCGYLRVPHEGFPERQPRLSEPHPLPGMEELVELYDSFPNVRIP